MPLANPKAASLRFWYGRPIAEFVESNAEKIVGQLTLNSSFDIDRTQHAAWLSEIEFLQSQLQGLAGSVFFEFNIPQMARRIDLPLFIGPVGLASERKAGGETIAGAGIGRGWENGLTAKPSYEPIR